MVSKAARALPALLSAAAGVAVYIWATADNLGVAVGWPILALLVGGASLLIGWLVIGRTPYVGVLLISGWIVGLVALGAGVVGGLLWLIIAIPGWLDLESEELKEASRILGGAVTTYAAVLVTDDLDKGKGPLWPSTLTKKALSAKFTGDFDHKSREYAAAFSDFVPADEDGTGTIEGWGFVARWQRAGVLAGD